MTNSSLTSTGIEMSVSDVMFFDFWSPNTDYTLRITYDSSAVADKHPLFDLKVHGDIWLIFISIRKLVAKLED